MCHASRCRTCGKTTWKGCGQHVSQVRARVPVDQWCPGHADADADPNANSWLRRFVGR